MGWGRRLWLVACALALGACAPETSDYLRDYAEAQPVPERFQVCHGYGCKVETRVVLSDSEWQRVRAAFEPVAATASAERRQIATALAILELEVGERTGTAVHQRRELNTGDLSQLDCIDEAVNTWTYLTMLSADGLIRRHSVAGLAHSGSVIELSVHNAAVIRRTTTGTAYAVDTTLVDAGEAPPVVPLSIWLASWPPQVPGNAGTPPPLPDKPG
jgi:hypothetical protein